MQKGILKGRREDSEADNFRLSLFMPPEIGFTTVLVEGSMLETKFGRWSGENSSSMFYALLRAAKKQKKSVY